MRMAWKCHKCGCFDGVIKETEGGKKMFCAACDLWVHNVSDRSYLAAQSAETFHSVEELRKALEPIAEKYSRHAPANPVHLIFPWCSVQLRLRQRSLSCTPVLAHALPAALELFFELNNEAAKPFIKDWIALRADPKELEKFFGCDEALELFDEIVDRLAIEAKKYLERRSKDAEATFKG